MIGFPRIGFKRDFKTILEKCFDFEKISKNNNLYYYLKELKRKILYINWNLLIKNKIDLINIGDFSFYDNVLDAIQNFNLFPKRFNFKNENNLKNYFICSKGIKNEQPMEMLKWFNTNYHYVVPEYFLNTKVFFSENFISEDIKFSEIFKKNAKFIIIGPFTLLKLGKIKDNLLNNRLFLLPDILDNYIKFLNYLNKNKNIKIIQIDEPIFILNISKIWILNIKNFYNLVSSYFSNIIITTYFDKINCNILNDITNFSVFSIHLDISKNYYNFKKIKLNNIKHVSLGIIDGKNIWINDLEKSFYILNKFKYKNFFLSSSCSLIYIPIDKNLEKNFNKKNKKVKNWISFCFQKIEELKELNNLFLIKNKFLNKYLFKNLFFIKNKKKSNLIFIKKIQKKIRNINLKHFKKKSIFLKNKKNLQNKYFGFDYFVKTTIGSFPQTKKIRKLRLDLKKKIINNYCYEDYIKREINYIIKKQTDYCLDVIVHGEPERNDMVEYFSESFEGFLITEHGWVQSYGSRYVKPPIIFGDICLKKYISINWLKYSQSLTKKPVKGMFTGPVTIIKWSFRRTDQPSYITSIQLSLAINKEILKLENIGIKIIQIDEPAIIEFLPIKILNYKNYFNWIFKSYLLINKGLKNSTQLHTHICYSNFKNILPLISNMNLNVLSIETSRSNFEVLNYININEKIDIGLGLYDIHNKNIMCINKSLYILKLIINNIKLERIWINPDCGLKTRKWSEIDKSLLNMSLCSKIIKSTIFNF